MMQISRSVCPLHVHLGRVIKIHEDILVSNAKLKLIGKLNLMSNVDNLTLCVCICIAGCDIK